MNRPAVRILGLLGFAALLAQAGHLIAYQIQFAGAASAVQSQGAHAYFPDFVKASLGVAAGGLLAGLVVIGVARLASGRPVVLTGRGPSFLSLLSILFTLQLVCFVAQETLESMVAGNPVPSALRLILIGSAGQLPVALLGAHALKWLLVRIEAVLLTLGVEPALRPVQGAVALRLISFPQLITVSALAETCPAAYIKRGPPATLRA